MNDPINSALSLLSDAHRRITGLLRDMPPGVSPDVSRAGLIAALQKVVAEELSDAFDEVEWHIDPEVIRKMSGIPLFASEVLFYAAREAMRNSARHGRGREGDPVRPLRLCVSVAWREGERLELIIEDSGVGMKADAFHNSGQRGGRGLALHGTLMAVVGGSLSMERVPGVPGIPSVVDGGGEITRVSLILPHRQPSNL